MSETLTRPRPQIDDPEALERVVRRLVARFDPAAVFLFGSRARGDAGEDSDYDLMLVLKDNGPPVSWEELREAARGQGIDANPFTTRVRPFAWRRHEVGTLAYEVAIDGIQLYPRQPWRPPSVQRPGSMNATVVEEWLRRVDEDLDAAHNCCEGARKVPTVAAYHVQQAAEKLTKAALVANQRRPRKGHKIEEFAPRLPARFPLKARFRALERFSTFAWVWRYPEDPGEPPPPPEPKVDEVRAWLTEVEAHKVEFEQWLAAREGGGRS